jgi:hypothetical protein
LRKEPFARCLCEDSSVKRTFCCNKKNWVKVCLFCISAIEMRRKIMVWMRREWSQTTLLSSLELS